MEGWTLVVIILDRSSSMIPFRDDVLEGFNALIDEQKSLPGQARLILAQFDREYEITVDGVALERVAHLTRATYVAGRGTALLDAVGYTIDEVAVRLRAWREGERPARLLVYVFTDGEENCSRRYTPTVVREKVHDCRACGWRFSFLGSVPRAVEDSIQWGIDLAQTVLFSPTAFGFRQAFRVLGESLAEQRKDILTDSAVKKMN